MTQCTSTANLVTVDGVYTGIILRCELEAEHDNPTYAAMQPLGVGRDHPYEFEPTTPHAFTFRWENVTPAELAEVEDPDESFDLEVDIAPEAALEQQQNAALDNGATLEQRDYERIPDAAPRCAECGREVELDRHSTYGYRHIGFGPDRPAVRHSARVACRDCHLTVLPDRDGLRHLVDKRHGHAARV